MLSPNVDFSEQHLLKSIQAASVFTIYSAAMRDVLAPWLVDIRLPDWYTPIKNNIDTAVAHAKTWEDSLCSQVTNQVPQTFIDYNIAFQVTTDKIANLISEIALGGGNASSLQHDKANRLLGDLLTRLGKEAGVLRGLHQQLVALMDDLQQDHRNLVDAQATIAQNIPNGGASSKQIQANLGNDFLDFQTSGPCFVSLLSIKASILTKITISAGSAPSLLPYAVGLKLVEKGISDNSLALEALSSVLNMWQLLQDLLQDVVGRLKKAGSEGVLPILQKLDIKIAQNAWTQLDLFAKRLEGCSLQGAT